MPLLLGIGIDALNIGFSCHYIKISYFEVEQPRNILLHYTVFKSVFETFIQ